MKPSTIRYFIREGLSGLKMNMLMTMASIVAVAACISILSFSYCVGSNLRYMLGQMEDSIGISVFLKGDLSGEQIENMKDEIAKIDHVQSVEYISPSASFLVWHWGLSAAYPRFVSICGYKQSEKQNNNEKRGEVFWRMLPLSYRIIPFGET